MSNSSGKDRVRVGEIIRREREKKGISIEELSDITKISKEFIKAIEEENFDALPGDVYTRGFIRNISMVLGLDPEEMRELYKSQRKVEYEEEVIKKATETLPNYDADAEKGIKPKKPWLLVLVLLLLLAGGAFYLYASRTGNIILSTKSFVKEEPRKEATSAVSVVSSEKEKSAPEKSATAEVSVPQATETIALTENAITSPVEVATGPEKVSEKSEGVALRVIAIGRCWVRVIADDKKVYEGTLTKGEERSWRAEKSIKVRFGNISGVKIFFNGKEITPPAGRGGVVDMVFPPEEER